MRSYLGLGAVVLGLGLLGGCVAAVGVIADVPSAAQAGVGLFEKGKITEVDNATMPDVVAAVQRAANNLGLMQTADTSDKPQERTIKYADERGQEVAVTIQRRTEVLTLTHLDVGLFGPPALNRLMLDEIVSELVYAKAYGPRTHRAEAASQPRHAREGHGYDNN